MKPKYKARKHSEVYWALKDDTYGYFDVKKEKKYLSEVHRRIYKAIRIKITEI